MKVLKVVTVAVVVQTFATDESNLLQHKAFKVSNQNDPIACSPGTQKGRWCADNGAGGYCPQPQCVRDDTEPQACCRALTASCLACGQGVTVEEFCLTAEPNTVGCPENCGQKNDTNFSIYFDSATEVTSKRAACRDTPLEIAYLFKNVKKQHIKVTRTHVQFPISHMIQAFFTRHTHPFQVKEYGVVNMVFGMQHGGLVGSAEKMHSMLHDGSWRRDSAEFAISERKNRSEADNEEARKVRHNKTYLANMFTISSRLASQMVAAASDPDDMKNTASFFVGKEATPHLLTQMRKLKKDLEGKYKAIKKMIRKGKNPKSSASNCLHFKESGGAVKLAGNAFTVRRKVMVESYKGQTIFTPLQQFSFARGISIINYEKTSDTVMIYHAATSFFAAQDLDGTHMDPSPTLYLGSLTTAPPGNLWPDRRVSPVSGPFPRSHAIWAQYAKLPMDYEHQYDEANCRDGSEAHDTALDLFNNFDTVMFISKFTSPDTPPAELFGLSHQLSKLLADSADCLAPFVRGSIDKTTGYGINNAVALIHAVLEVKDILGDAMLKTRWNDLNQPW